MAGKFARPEVVWGTPQFQQSVHEPPEITPALQQLLDQFSATEESGRDQWWPTYFQQQNRPDQSAFLTQLLATFTREEFRRRGAVTVVEPAISDIPTVAISMGIMPATLRQWLQQNPVFHLAFYCQHARYRARILAFWSIRSPACVSNFIPDLLCLQKGQSMTPTQSLQDDIERERLRVVEVAQA